MARRSTRLFATAVVATLTGLLAACGGGADAATSATATSAPVPAETAPATPRIAEASVAPAPEDPDASATYGAEFVGEAYAEMVELATHDAVDPAYFAWTGGNTPDLLAPVYARLDPAILDDTKEKAQKCLEFDHQACVDIEGLAFFDVGADWERFTYLPDGTFVTAQSVTNPAVSLQMEAESRLVVSFDHTVTIQVAMNGTPVVLTLTRQLTYYLVPSAGGGAHPWMISGYRVQLGDASITDPATGQPVPEPAEPATPTA